MFMPMPCASGPVAMDMASCKLRNSVFGLAICLLRTKLENYFLKPVSLVCCLCPLLPTIISRFVHDARLPACLPACLSRPGLMDPNPTTLFTLWIRGRTNCDFFSARPLAHEVRAIPSNVALVLLGLGWWRHVFVCWACKSR